MAKTRKSARQAGPKRGADRASSAYLDKLIEEATVDCYNESEEITGIFTMLEENLAVPFSTTLLGMEVSIEEKVEMDRRKKLARREKKRAENEETGDDASTSAISPIFRRREKSQSTLSTPSLKTATGSLETAPLRMERT